MEKLLSVTLNGLRFFAFHGVHDEEQLTGNEFEVSLVVNYVPETVLIEKLSDTINYVSLYNIIKEEMKQPANLLETLAMRIVQRIHNEFQMIQKATITIDKLNAPIENFIGKVGVGYSREF